MASDAQPIGDKPAASSALTSLRDGGARLLQRIGEHRVMLIAAGVTYYVLLALVPALSVFVSLYGLFNDRATVSKHVDMLIGIVPSGGLDIIRDQLTRLTSAPQAALSLTLIGSLLVALWSSSAGIKALFDAMNVAYEEEEKRNFFVLNALALLFTLGGVVATLVTLGAVVVIPAVLELFYLGKGFEWLVTALGYVVMLVVLVAAIGALYRWGPSRHEGKWKWITPGTVLTIVATVVVSLAFSWYAANFGNYNAAYGSLGAIVGLMTWLWLTITILIVGAELNAEAEGRAIGPSAVEAGTSPHPPVVRKRRANLASLAIVIPAAVLLGLAARRQERGSKK